MTAEPANIPRRRQLVEGEFVFTEEDFDRIAKMLHDDAGIYLPEAKATLVYSRLAKRLRALGLESFRDYCTILTEQGGRGADERQPACRRCVRPRPRQLFAKPGRNGRHPAADLSGKGLFHHGAHSRRDRRAGFDGAR